MRRSVHRTRGGSAAVSVASLALSCSVRCVDEAEGALVVSSVDEALEIAREETARTDAPYIWITGGAQLYAQTLPLLDEAVVTDLELDVAASAPEGSTFVYAPPLDPALWRRDEERSDTQWRERPGDARWKVTPWVQH